MPHPASETALPRPEAPVGRALAEVAATAGVAPIPATWAGVTVTGITHDSRAVRAGDVYAALAGSQTHGARFAAGAAGVGAVAVLTDDAGAVIAGDVGLPILAVHSPRAVLGQVAGFVYGDPSRSLLVIGVTGTSGKTTTSYLIESGLRTAGHRAGLVGTVETKIAGHTLPSVLTTPESTDLHALFAYMKERGVSAAVMEVSSHALSYGRVDGVEYDIAVFTNLSQDHLDFHGNMAGYFAAKRELFTPGRAKVGIVNVDDSYGRRLAAASDVEIITVSPAGDPAAWRVVEAHSVASKTTVTVAGPDGARITTAIGLPGRFNVANATLAIAALVTAGVSPENAAAGVAACRGVPGRMERVDAGQPFFAVVDYAHKPAAVEGVLSTLRDVTKGRLIAVVGCGGDRDAAKRGLMGAAGARLADVLVITDDNPRFEDPAAIRAAALDGARRVPNGERAELIEIADRRDAIIHAIGLARRHDTVAVLGKGHEQGQERDGVVTPFDDRTEVRSAIRATDPEPGAPR